MATESKLNPQDELFLVHIRNFVNDAPSHRQWLNNWLAKRVPDIQPDINSWIEGKNFPELTAQSRIMDATWTHYCDCKCK
ncbi:MAG: hypothetical protein Q7S43_05435 [bacterium]|nr:hypothetical protein [bacterium]